MEDTYDIKTHGDPLERDYVDFIRTYFSTYEDVWRLYIGNKGNNTKADILGYAIDRENSRQEFSEHTYTILQSTILLHRLINNESFIQPKFFTVNQKLDLQDNLILFFTHLGRIRDNVEDASTCLLNIDTMNMTSLLDEFFHKRHILVHGKIIPIILKEDGKILLPILSKNGLDITGWNHKHHKWEDITQMKIETLDVTVSQLYWGLISKLCHIFGEFRDKIEQELNLNQSKLIYDWTQANPNSFGSGFCAVDVYGLSNKNPQKWG